MAGLPHTGFAERLPSTVDDLDDVDASTVRWFDSYGFVLRQLQRAAAESDVRRFMEGEDQLLRDAISWGKQADYERRRADRAEHALSRSIRQLRGLGQEPGAIAVALSIDVDEVRHVLAASEDREGSA